MDELPARLEVYIFLSLSFTVSLSEGEEEEHGSNQLPVVQQPSGDDDNETASDRG